MRVGRLVAIGVVPLALAAACGSSQQGHYSISQVKSDFAAQGISLQNQPGGPDPAGTIWLTGNRYTVLVGVFKSAQESAEGTLPDHGHVTHHGNVVVICHGPCPRDVTLALQQLR